MCQDGESPWENHQLQVLSGVAFVARTKVGHNLRSSIALWCAELYFSPSSLAERCDEAHNRMSCHILTRGVARTHVLLLENKSSGRTVFTHPITNCLNLKLTRLKRRHRNRDRTPELVPHPLVITKARLPLYHIQNSLFSTKFFKGNAGPIMSNIVSSKS